MILIFGAGQLGRAVHDLLTRSRITNVLIPKFQCDITDPKQIGQTLSRYAGRIDGVVNCAAFTKVDEAEFSQDNWRANAYGPTLLSDHLHHLAPSAIGIHISSDYVFGEFGVSGPYFDDDLSCPVNEYGRAKLTGEKGWLSFPRRKVIRVQNLSSLNGGIVGKFREMALHGLTPNIDRATVLKPTSVQATAEAIAHIIGLKFDQQIIHYAPIDMCSVEQLWSYVSQGLAYHLTDMSQERAAKRNPKSILHISEGWPKELKLTWRQHVDLILGRMELRDEWDQDSSADKPEAGLRGNAEEVQTNGKARV